MSDLEKYIAKREKKSPGFKKSVIEEYNNMMIGARIKG